MRESLRRLTPEEGWRERRMGDTRRVRVELMDGEHITVDMDRKARGSDLLDKVCDNLDLVEKDYFGLLHAQRGDPRLWVDLNRRLSKTFKNEPWDVKFAVKFYPPEPSELGDDLTRHQLVLAVSKDLMEGRLTCSNITHALLASYRRQAERGDRPPAARAPLALCDEMEDKIDELYMKHTGQTPAEADLNYLETAKRLPLYGAELHVASDVQWADIVLAVTAHGVAVFRDGQVMNRFPWAKITKISYNKRTYTLRLRTGEFDEFENHVIFRLPSTTAAKKLWRCSVEHHIFFRRETPVKVERVTGFPRLGSRRVSCRRTLRQLRAEPSAQPALVA
ncbi:protein 4.1 homolog [Amyelois transitella]|uniref:protein 4.1 homolog n=1 Tax=Amyelois transitella TaxID=680683 RepID=UPI00298FFEC5|nr:protein 4.1 homolog [Amyelois transitella]